MTDSQPSTPPSDAAVRGLAVVGFVALVALGIWLAIYSSRFVPAAVGRLGSAAVYVGSLFVSSPSSGLAVVPTASTTIPFGGIGAASTTPAAATSTAATSKRPTAKPAKPVVPAAGNQTSETYPLGTAAPALYGLPDLAVTIGAVGYLTSSSTNSFVAATTVPQGAIPAVKFTVKNIGTNVAEPWRFSAAIPTATNYLYQSIPQQSLNPGDYIDFTLGFSQPTPGANRTITITANYDHAIPESNTENDTATAELTILGS